MDFKDEKIDKYLDELADEYKELLLAALVERTNSFENLSVSDLLRLDSEIKKPLMSGYARRERRKRNFRFISLLYMGFGLSMYFVFDMHMVSKLFNDSIIFQFIQPMGAIFAIVGVLMLLLSFSDSLLSFLLPKYGHEKIINENESFVMYEVVTTWRDIEGLANDLSTKDGLVRAPSAIQFLVENRFINEDEQKILKELLKLRNEIVHSSAESNSFSTTQMINSIKEARKILGKVSKII